MRFKWTSYQLKNEQFHHCPLEYFNASAAINQLEEQLIYTSYLYKEWFVVNLIMLASGAL